MLYILDVDGTIAEKYTLNIYPGVRKWFEDFDWEENKIALVTNQGGVGLRYWMEEDGFGEPSKYPTVEQVSNRLNDIEKELIPSKHRRNFRYYASFAYQSKNGKWGPTPDNQESFPEWKHEWRKPQPGMLLQAMQDADMLPKDTIMVGDRDEDKEASRAIGIKFVLAIDFFGNSV